MATQNRDRATRTYRVTGINLRSKPSGEADRLMTILTKEHGLIRVIAPSARKQKSSLSGRSGLFVVNDLMIAQGKSMDKITQAESLQSFPKLSLDIRKLTAAQYLAELALQQALSEQSQESLYYLLLEHLDRLEASPIDRILPHLTHAIFQLLALAGIAPQLYQCCLSGETLHPEVGNPVWRAMFSVEAGGLVSVAALRASNLKSDRADNSEELLEETNGDGVIRVMERPMRIYNARFIPRPVQLGAIQVSLMQQLAASEVPQLDPTTLPGGMSPDRAWLSIERLLRQCARYHFDRPIRSATLIEQVFV
jgi:DNA repair protein RecO (recombination protein O)